MTEITQINERYSGLAESACCLSCGGAIDYARASSGEVCVDLGSGRGTDAIRLAGQVGPTGFVYGFDIADGMLEKARNTADKLGAGNVEFHRRELADTGLPGGIADLVISNCTLNHSSDKEAVWKEINRILKKGGRFVISDIYAVEEVPEAFRNDPVAVAECWAGAVTKPVYLKQIAGAGLLLSEIIEESAPYRKGKAVVASFTLAGRKPSGCACGCDN